jgi:fructose-1,6-bisphosphatase II / sedoheptulose-1,7-bisphosphatase
MARDGIGRRDLRRTGVTDGSVVRGARRDGEWLETETILMRSKTGSLRRIVYRQRNQ